MIMKTNKKCYKTPFYLLVSLYPNMKKKIQVQYPDIQSIICLVIAFSYIYIHKLHTRTIVINN